MGYSGKAYKNTGFNTSNIPDSPALLEQCAQYDFTYNLEIMQDRFLNSIDVNVIDYETIKDTDYCRVGSWYYFVTGVSMLATDVAHFTLTPDFITSANGIMGFNVLDGITERVHVSDDSFGKADSADPLLTPFEPLHIKSHWKKPAHAGKTYAESTLNIAATATQHESITYKDTITATAAQVSVPKAIGVKLPTTFTYQNGNTESHGTLVYNLCSDGGTDSYQQTLGEQVGELRSLGLEQAIINQVRIPNAFISTDIRPGTHNVMDVMTGRTGTWTLSEFPYIEHVGVKNALINYSKYLKYGLISCSGESCEFEPQDLKAPADVDTYPTIKWITDPHLDGKPYFRFTKVNGDSSADGFWRNCISGMAWKQIPLVFTGASGSALNQLKFENAREIAAGSYNLAAEGRKATQANTRGDNFDWITGEEGRQLGLSGDHNPLSNSIDMFGYNVAGLASKTAAGMNYRKNYTYNEQMQSLENKVALYDYGAELKSQLLDIAINANVVVPTVNFPFNSHILQDQFENGVLAYKYSYTANDVTRIDKLLTMYGYKYAKALETSDFTNRRYFNFVECSNVTVTGHARWWNDGIAAQLKGGVRIWHVLPSPTYYSNNPVA